MAQSVKEKAKKLKAEYDELVQGAVQELLEQRRAIDVELREFGYEDGGSRKRSTGKARVCSLCGAVGHNSRTCPNKKKKDKAS